MVLKLTPQTIDPWPNSCRAILALPVSQFAYVIINFHGPIFYSSDIAVTCLIESKTHLRFEELFYNENSTLKLFAQLMH